MKRTSSFRALLVLFTVALAALSSPNLSATPTPLGRVTTSFDADWRFLKGDTPGAEQPEFSDAAWRRLSVPHDWSIEGPFDANNPTGGSGGFLPAGIGWYRKHFTLPARDKGRRVFADFDGVMANSDVWINGSHLGHRPYGYVSFRYELTGHLRFNAGVENVLAVRADNSGQPASRWYTGAGIYRHVRLVVTDPVHLEHWGTFITTPQVTADQATVHVESAVVNQSGKPSRVTVQVRLVDPEGKSVRTAETPAQTIATGKSADFRQDLTLPKPRLWDIAHPTLYRAVVQVRASNTTLDDETDAFGVRTFHFDAATGFWLNGRNLKIKGVCLHHDASALGAAVPLSAWERRLAALKPLGVNAVRTSHNPPAPEFLDLCDRMGFLVMDEMFDVWTVAKRPFDYHLHFTQWAETDLRDTVRRDRNHPSIILYSAGNEIHDTPNAVLAHQILTSLVAAFHANDPTRPVTQALFRPNASHDYDNGLADLLDVVGQNYRERELLTAHAQKPTRKIIGTENGHDRTVWLALRDNPALAGQFLWTGVDYLGEAGRWPTIGSSSGLLDRTDAPRPLAFQRQSWWSDAPMVFIVRRTAPTRRTPTDPGYGPADAERRPQTLFPDWTPRDPALHLENVEVYSNCPQVELFLNGRSLGVQPHPADDRSRAWSVPYEPGTLRAVATDGGRTVATHELRTAGPPARLQLATDRPHLRPIWDDVAYVTATIVDANGVPVPTASDLVTFAATGPGAIIAVDSADNAGHEPFQATSRHAYQGRCIALVRATAPNGSLTVTAAAPGLTPASVTIQATPPNMTRAEAPQEARVVNPRLRTFAHSSLRPTALRAEEQEEDRQKDGGRRMRGRTTCAPTSLILFAPGGCLALRPQAWVFNPRFHPIRSIPR